MIDGTFVPFVFGLNVFNMNDVVALGCIGDRQQNVLRNCLEEYLSMKKSMKNDE